MERNHGFENKRVQLFELGSKLLQKALTVDNIKLGFKRIHIWHLNPDSLSQDM
jgi:hypothetical protein